MKTKILSLFLLTAILLSVAAISADTLSEWSLTTDGSASNVDANINAGTFTSSGVVDFDFHSTNGAFAEDWSLTDSIDTAKYFEVIISPNSDYTLTVSDIDFDYSASIDGPASFELQYSTQAGFGSPTSIIIKDDASTIEKSSSNSGLNIQINSEETLTLRWFGYDFNEDTNEFRIKNLNIEGTATKTKPEESMFCNNGAIGDENLKLKKVKITNKGKSEDSEDNQWFPLDTIEVEVELENNGEEEIEDIIFELGLFEEGSTSNIAEDMLWISEDNEEIEIGDIEEKGQDDELKHTFEFRVNPEDLDKGDYVLKIKAYSDDLGEDTVCIDYSEDLSDKDFGNSIYYAKIKIDKEKENDERPVVVDVDKLPSPIDAQCDTEVSLVADVWNIGEVDQEQVKVTLFNEELGLDMDYTLRGGLDEGDDKEEVEFVFKVPKNAEQKIHTLDFQTYYDYDEDDDTFDERSKVFKAYLKVEGNCEGKAGKQPQITAELSSETPNAIAGKQVIIKATIKNIGDKTTTYSISVSGNSEWSTLTSIEPKEITLNEEESKNFYINLDLDSDAQGDKEFTIKAAYDEQVTEQKIALFIENPVAGITGSAVGDHVRTNWFIYVIAVINIILIIAIIAVVKSMANKTTAR